MRKEALSCDDVETLIDHLLPQLEGDFQVILMITRGGIIPGGMLAEAMQITQVLTAAVDFPATMEMQAKSLMSWPHFLQFPADELLRGKRVLVVDDVWGSGRTITAVPRQYREAAIAMGATKWQTTWRIVARAARPGMLAAVMLGIGRVIGETMAVMMVTGNAAMIPRSFLQPVRTLTATIAAEMGESVQGGPHYAALFAIGIVLFIITFLINGVADIYLHRSRR